MIELKILLRKTGARLNFKIALISLLVVERSWFEKKIFY
jgi:hypothetical protein